MRFLVKKKLLRPYATGAGTGYSIPLPTGAGSTYYVSPTGNNSNNGSSGQPWLTPAKAASTATTPGDVVVFRDGTYSPSLVTPPAGSVGAPITWVAENCGGAIFDGLYYIDFGLLLENCNYFHLRGFDVQNYAYGALWSNANNSTSTYTTNVTIDYCYIHNNGRTPRPVSDSLGYVGLYTNGMTHSWTVDKCGFFLNGRKPNHDFDGETSGNNHSYRHDHGWYCQGYNHTCSNNYFMGHTSGYPIRTGGYWKATALTAGEYSVSIMDCKFFTSLNESVYGDVHGLIGVYNNLTAHGGVLGTTKEGVLRVENCIAAASRAGTGTNTLIGFFNDAQSYGSTTTTHRFVNNTCASAKLYNEGESWLASHTGITATGNTVNTPVLDATLTTWFADASTLLGKTVGESGAYPWTPHILARTAQVGFWDARNSSKVTEVSGLVSDWANENYDAVSWTQGTAANRPDYVSSSIRPLDSTDFMEGATRLYPMTAGDFIFAMVGSDNKLSVGGWIRLTNYTGGGSGFKFNHFGSSWFAYYDQGGGGQSGSFTSASYTANTDVLFSFKHDANTDFEVFQNGTSRLNFTPAAPWTSTASLLAPTGGGVGMDKCKAVLAIAGDATDVTRQYAEGFLAWEFGLQGSLAGVHPWDADYPNVTDVTGRFWVPSDLPSLAAWFDASDASTITLNGSRVSQWDDKSGNNYHLTQATAGEQPLYETAVINGLNVVTNDSSRFLARASSIPVLRNVSGGTLVAIVRYGSGTTGAQNNGMSVFVNNAADPGRSRLGLTPNPWPGTAGRYSLGGRRLDSDSYETETGATSISTSFVIEIGNADYANAQANHWTNGTQDITAAAFQTAGNTSNTDSLGIAVFNSIANTVQVSDNTSLGEVFFIDATLPTIDRQKLEGYLAHKWQLQASLPSDHPYRHFPPRV